MKASKNDLHRLLNASKRLAFCLAASCALAGPALAAKKIDFYTVPLNASGSSAKVGGPGSSPAAFPSVGNITPVSGSGWYSAGNYGVAPPATGPTMNMNIMGEVGFSGVKYPFQAGYAVPKSNLWAAAQGVAAVATGGWVGAALFAGPYMLDWLTKAGGRVSPSGDSLELYDTATCPSGNSCSMYYIPNSTAGLNDSTIAGVCQRTAAAHLGAGATGTYTNLCQMYRPNGSYYTGWGVSTRTVTAPTSYLPKSMNDIAPYMTQSSVNPDGRVIGELLDKGADLTMPAPTVTGPASISGPESTTVNPDGTKRVEKTTYNFNTSGDTINNTSNVTTVTIKDSNNVTTSVTTTTKTPAPEDKPQSECEKNPDVVGCKKTDIPTDKVPTKTETITWAEENLGFGGGTCPAPIAWHTSLLDGSIDLANYCTALTTYVRPVVILLAFLAAFFIVAPVREA